MTGCIIPQAHPGDCLHKYEFLLTALPKIEIRVMMDLYKSGIGEVIYGTNGDWSQILQSSNTISDNTQLHALVRFVPQQRAKQSGAGRL